jgi:L-rhamnose mutarotase
MIFLNIQDKHFVLFRIKRFIESLHRKKKVLKRHSEEYKKVINQIAFYRRISQKIQQCQGAVEYSLFTEENENEIFYISMILGMRGHYQTLKKLSELRFTEYEKLHTDLQKWLRRVLEFDPTLFADYQQLNQLYNRIVPISSTVALMRTPFLYGGLNEYQIWIQNLIDSFALLRDYESWRPNNFHNDKWMRCCPAPCTCYIEDIEEKMYRIICGNVFFNNYQHRHETPPWSYWSNKAGFFFVI